VQLYDRSLLRFHPCRKRACLSTFDVMAGLLLISCVTASAPPPFTDTYPWQRVPTMCQTHLGGTFSRHNMTGTGRFSDAAVRSA
jgi:hypothetical protein